MGEVEPVQLSARQELRFLMNEGDSVTLEVTDGVALHHGWHLPGRSPVIFADQPFPISTVLGCHVRFSGKFVSYYTTPYDVPAIVDHIRDRVNSSAPPSPVVFVVGAPGVGKTSLCKLLVNTILAIDGRRHAFYVNADPSQAAFVPPGCLGTVPISQPVNNRGFPLTDPLCYFYGALELEEERQPLFIDQLTELNHHLQTRRKQFALLDGGVVIDFPAVTSKCVQDTLESAIELFQTTNIVVMADDRLALSLRRKFPKIQLEKLTVMPGAAPLSAETKAVIRRNDTRRYFYGDAEAQLSPTTYFIGKGQVDLFSLGPLDVLAKGLLPIAMETPDPKVASPVAFTAMLEGIIMAVVKTSLKSEIWKQNVLGFLHACGAPNEEKQLPVLMPTHGLLPSKTVIVSRVKWSDR
jgi:energy-coupling factor transporter ATP-binding protein EcfA2